MSELEHGHAERDHGGVISRPLYVPDVNTAILFEPAYQALELIALLIGRPVKAELTRLVLAARDHGLNPAMPEAAPRGRAGVALISRCPARPQPRTASPLAWHRAPTHERV